jgi:hypothetical protein
MIHEIYSLWMERDVHGSMDEKLIIIMWIFKKFVVISLYMCVFIDVVVCCWITCLLKKTLKTCVHQVIIFTNLAPSERRVCAHIVSVEVI